MASKSTSLLQLSPDFFAPVSRMQDLSPMMQRRLADLGLFIGTPIALRRTAPFGGPVTIQFGSQQIGIRRSEAAQIEVLLV